MTQIVATGLTTPLTLNNESVIVAQNGSISSDNAGPALSFTVTNDATGLVAGGLAAIGGPALKIQAQPAANFYIFEIAATASIISGGPDAGDRDGVDVTGDVILNTAGDIFGADAGVDIYASGYIGNTLLFNSGQISGATGVLVDAYDYPSIRNEDTGVITGFNYGIEYTPPSQYSDQPLKVVNYGFIGGVSEGIYATGTLTLQNHGTIVGGVKSPSSGVAKAGSAPAAHIVNDGDIQANDHGHVIVLGDGADVVKNDGHLEGDVRLGGGADTFRGSGIVDGEVRGQGGADHLLGSGNADALFGGRGGDILEGKGGDDLISPGAGRDEIFTGKGHDVIVYGHGDGHDTVFDFKPGKDTLDLTALKFADFSDLKSAMTEDHGNVYIDLSGSDQVVLKHVDLSHLSAHDFIL
jgi:Ca2+-binding RTX toxin-like protein